MNKNFFQDVVPPERRSIRNIPIMGARRKKRPFSEEEFVKESVEERETEGSVTEDYSYQNFQKDKPEEKKFISGKIFVTLVIVFVASFIFIMMTAFTSAKIDIVPKKETVSFNLSLKAEKSAITTTTGSVPALKFEVVEVKKEKQIEVPASGEEMAEKKSSGTLIIYNNFSEDPQRLIARTRFEAPGGLIYRISESVTIPPKTSAGPGIIEVKVSADEAGEKYNIDKTDFTIPGFKSDAARYKGFYAKSKTPMTGGFIGKVKKVSENDRIAAIKKLEESAKSELDKEALTKIPDGFVSLPGSTIYEFNDLGQVNSSGSEAVLKVEGIAHVVVFSKQSLAALIFSKEFLPEWQGMQSEIRSWDDMVVSFDPGFNISADTVPLRLVGTSTIFASINGIDVANSLRSVPKGNLNQVMSQFKGVSNAKASVRPLWKTSFPENTAKIHINIE